MAMVILVSCLFLMSSKEVAFVDRIDIIEMDVNEQISIFQKVTKMLFVT